LEGAPCDGGFIGGPDVSGVTGDCPAGADGCSGRTASGAPPDGSEPEASSCSRCEIVSSASGCLTGAGLLVPGPRPGLRWKTRSAAISAAVRPPPAPENDRAVGIVGLGDLAIEQDENSALADISAAEPND